MPANPALKGQLPGYVWDTRMQGGRYRTIDDAGKLGKLVSRDDIVGLVRDLSDKTAERFGNLARDAVNGVITPADFQEAMTGELRSLYNSTSALGAGGWNQLGPAEWGRNGQILKGEYTHLAGFAQDIADGKLTEAQAAARATLYSGKGYSRFWDEDARRQQDGGMDTERWEDTGLPGECGDCAKLAAKGTVPIGTLGCVPGDGSTECGGHCRCEIVYSKAEVKQAEAA